MITENKSILLVGIIALILIAGVGVWMVWGGDNGGSDGSEMPVYHYTVDDVHWDSGGYSVVVNISFEERVPAGTELVFRYDGDYLGTGRTLDAGQSYPFTLDRTLGHSFDELREEMTVEVIGAHAVRL